MNDTSDSLRKGSAAGAVQTVKPMRFGLIVEGSVPIGSTYHRRYMEMIDEAVYAEAHGFDFWGTSEQHFLLSFGVSATEVLEEERFIAEHGTAAPYLSGYGPAVRPAGTARVSAADGGDLPPCATAAAAGLAGASGRRELGCHRAVTQ